MNRRQVLLGGAALTLAPGFARAQGVRPLKIGVMNDMSGVYADFQGIGSVIAAQLAVDDYSTKLGAPVEIVSADHQNKPDVGAAIARKWFDEDHVEFGGRTRGACGRHRKEQGRHRLRRRRLSDDRAEML